ncbi:hypothetical protein ACFE04_012224 [Oxalis oulophora]
MASMVMPAGSPQRHSRGQPGGGQVDKILRMLLFVSSLVAVIVMVTSQQTKNIYVPAYNTQVPILAKYNQVPAFIYFVVALAVASFYGITTTLLVTLKPSLSTKLSLQIVFLDTVLLSIVAAAIGATGSFGYIGQYGNKYTADEMYKNQLQELAQRSCFNLPSYACIREGPDHAPRFKATVNFNGETFESPAFCNTLRQAEHTAAEVALNVLSKKGPSKALAAKVLDETGVYKNLLQETTHRAGLKLPIYTTIRSGPGHVPVFSCIVELAGMSFTGEPAKTKKQAQKNAAMTAWSALKKMSRSGSSSSSTTSSPLSDAGNNDEQEQVTVARYLATLKPLEGNNSADRGRRFRRNPAPPQRNLISFGDRSPYSLQHQTWLCPQYLSEMPMYQSWPREIPPQQQNHVLALSSFPRPQIFPLVQSVFHPDPLIPDVGQLLYFSNRAMPYPSPNMSQVTIQEIEEASQVEQKWLNGDRNFDGRNFPSASKSLESSSLRDKGDENNKEPIPITGNCTQVESEQIEKHNCNSSGLMDARPNISSRNQNIPHRSQSDIQPQNLGIRPVNGSARYSVVSPVKIRPVNGGLRSNLRTDNGALTNVPPPTKTLSSAYSIRPRPPVLKNNERCKPTASFIAPPVNIRSVIPVCTAPPTEKKLVSQIEKKIIDEPEKNISSTCSDFGKLQL